MLLETEKENVCINQIVGQKKQEIEVEGDIIVNDIKPDVLNIIATNGIVCIYKKEVMDGKVRIDGSINTYIIYLADDENSTVRSLNTVLDFTQVFDMENCIPNMTLKENINIKRFESKVLNGRKINVKAVLEVKAELYSNDNVEITCSINELEDIQILNNTKLVNSLVGMGSTRVYAKDTISIDTVDELAEILQANVKIIDKDIKLSYNKILAKADANVNILYLTEDNRVKNIETKISVMGFVDIENVSDNNICDVDYKIKNVIIKPNNSDAHSIYVEIEIEISCFVYENKNINLIEDLYSISEELNFTPKEIFTLSEKKNIKEICNIKEQISIPEIGDNQLYMVNVRTEILNSTIKNGKVIYEGENNLEVLFETNNGMDARNINLPFNFEILSEDISESSNVNTIIDIKNEEFVLSSNGSIDVIMELEFNTSISKNEKINVIDEIYLEETRQNNIYSMIIYFVKQGDTLWKIAKKFKSTIEDIARINGIEDINKIYPGQQLYIPKYVKRNIAV